MRVTLLLGLFCVACGVSEAEVREEIRRANYCTTAADCGNAGSVCPYGCDILVNKSQVDAIAARLRATSNDTCLYDCAQLKSIACESQVCVGKYQ